MVSKYNALRVFMGSTEMWNDKSKNGRILKWNAKTIGATLAERKKHAEELFAQLSLLGYVQKVEVRNAKTSNVYYVGAGNGTNGGAYMVSEYATNDKIAVYINNI